jgi:hypothetical protein
MLELIMVELIMVELIMVELIMVELIMLELIMLELIMLELIMVELIMVSGTRRAEPFCAGPRCGVNVMHRSCPEKASTVGVNVMHRSVQRPLRSRLKPRPSRVHVAILSLHALSYLVILRQMPHLVHVPKWRVVPIPVHHLVLIPNRTHRQLRNGTRKVVLILTHFPHETDPEQQAWS